MKLSALFMRDAKAFVTARTGVEKSFLLKESLPSQVFQSGFNWFAFEEFDWALSNEFWPSIQKLAIASGDSSLLMAVLDPEPEGYFMKEFGYYNWADVPVSISQDDYWNLLNVSPEGSPADSVLVNSEKLIWLPHSAAWAIRGERSSGVCVLAARERAQIDSWHGVDWALKTCLPNNFPDCVVPPEFATSLRLHYETST